MFSNTEWKSQSEKETLEIGQQLARFFEKGRVICLEGDLGVGKTYLTKGIGKALGISEREVKSPTFTIMREYDLGDRKLFHIDLYRFLGKEDSLWEHLEEILIEPNHLIVIEWGDNIKDRLPAERLELKLELLPDDDRLIKIING